MMNKEKELLDQIRFVLMNKNIMQDEKERRGENFNVFDILNLSRDECRLHSAYIAELLNPNGSHGLKDAFLRSFLSRIDIELELNIQDVNIVTEYSIGALSQDKTRGGRIDILITDNHGHAIIIENKIDAIDQKNQLLRYYNYAIDNCIDFSLIYLTRDGNDASDYSTGGNSFDYIRISYRENVLSWLNDCIGIAACFPLVRETIRQYITNLKKILYIMDADSLNKLVDLTTSKEYVESTLAIIDNSWDIQKKIRELFIKQLEIIADKKGLEIEYDENICILDYNTWIWFCNPSISKTWAIYIGNYEHNNRHGFLYGISRQIDDNTPELPQEILDELPHIWEESPKDGEFPLGYSYLYGKNGNGNWWRWDNSDTLKDMASGTLAQYIESEIIDKVLNAGLLEKVEAVTAKYLYKL